MIPEEASRANFIAQANTLEKNLAAHFKKVADQFTFRFSWLT